MTRRNAAASTGSSAATRTSRSANVGNGVQSVYVVSLPVGPIWFLHGFYLVTTALMLVWHRIHADRDHDRAGAGTS